VIREHFFRISNMRSRRRLWKKIVFTFAVLAMSISNVSSEAGTENKLYIYSDKELASFMKDIGYQNLWHNDMRISRNSDGTALRFLNEDKRKILVVTCDGSVKELDSPGPIAWLNDANQVIAWVTWTDNKGVTHYANGMSEKTPFSPEGGPEFSGKYFVKERLGSSTSPLSESCYTNIYTTERPNIPLAKVDICGTTKIFYKDNRVFLTGSQYLNGIWQEEEIRIFMEKGNTLEQIDRVIVPSPAKSSTHFYAMDFSPWDDEMLYMDFYDFPIRSIWYKFDLKTHQLNEVGKVPWFGGRAFYLQCNIIKNASEAKK
jgi:hypothetical protein